MFFVKKDQEIPKNLLTYYAIRYIIKTVKGALTNIRGKRGKERTMDEEMTGFEILKQVAEENQTRKILEILKESENLKEAIEKVEALIKK